MKKGATNDILERSVAAADGPLSTDISDEPPQLEVERLIDHIVQTHHEYVRTALTRITGYLSKLIDEHGGRHPELRRIASELEVLRDDLLRHMVKEERALFPYIRQLAAGRHHGPSPFGTIENPIRMMEHEHEEAGLQLREIRRLTGGYTAPADGGATYRVCFRELAAFERDLHRHVHLEDGLLFPRAVELENQRA
jgi:regulator of cell morphogenesis and NO signaling